MTQFTERFPVQVMAHMVGVPRADYPQFQKWAIDIIGFAKDYPRGLAAAAAVRDYLLPIIAERRAKPARRRHHRSSSPARSTARG